MSTNKQMLDRSLVLVRRIFEEASKMRMTLNPKKKGVSDITIVSYRKQMETLMRKIARDEKVYDLRDVQKEHVERAMAELANPYTLKKFIHAVSYFQAASERTGVLRRPLALIDKAQVLSDLKRRGIKRRISDSTAYKATQSEVLLVIEQISRMRTPFKRLVVEFLHFVRMTGARIDGAMNVCNKDIIIHPDGKADVHLLEKGGLHRVVRIFDPDSVIFLRQLKSKCRSENSRLFTFRNRRTGRVKSNKEAEKTIQAIIRAAAAKVAIFPSGQHFCTHSGRKAFAHARMMTYLEWSTRDLRTEIERRCEFKPEMYPKFRRVMRRTPDHPVSIRRKLILFLITTDIGHQRTDVLGFYVDRDQLSALLRREVEERDTGCLMGA